MDITLRHLLLPQVYIADVRPYFPFFLLYLKYHILISVDYILHRYLQLAHAFVRGFFHVQSEPNPV